MKIKGPLYPGLDEYIHSNMLKRQPRDGFFVGSVNKRGRDGYINLRKNSSGIEGWLMPSFDQEFNISLQRSEYSSVDRALKSTRGRVMGTYSTYFENVVDIIFGMGFDSPLKGDGENEFVSTFEIRSRLGEETEVYGRFSQDILEDTMLSVNDSLLYRDLEAGLKYDLFPRLFTGIDYRYRMNDDDNMQHRYKLWTMYHLFGELNQLKLRYSYENLRNEDGNIGRGQDNFRNNFAFKDRTYWSPDNYWQHRFSLHYKHFFNTLHHDVPVSYLAFDYSYGFEKDDRESHLIDVNIFLEINEHFLIKGNVQDENGDDYHETESTFTLIYRW